MTQADDLNMELYDEDSDFEDESQEEIEEEKEDSEITEPFDPTQIRIETKQLSIDLVLGRIQYNELDLAPEFQREAGIWKNTAKSRLIESILIRIPLPAFYMDATDEDKWLVVDGLQRLTTLKQFIIDQNLKLTGLEYLTDLNGKTYDKLPRKYQRRIQETQITAYLIEKGTPPEVKFNIFRRINTGGLPLSPQELRHALNQGKSTNFLAKLTQIQEFEEVTGLRNTRKQLRMEDRDFVLRFLAFTLTSYQNYKAKSLDLFLNNTMAELNKMPDEELKLLEQKFIQAMIVAQDLFGDYAFRKRSPENLAKKNPLNKALFEALSVNLSQLQHREIQLLKEKKSQLNEQFINLMNDNHFIQSISQGTDSIKKVRYRFEKIENLIRNVLSC